MTETRREVAILIAEDDDGHAELIQRNLARAGIHNPIIRFRDGEEVLAYLQRRRPGARPMPGTAYLLLLDIRMPKIDGIEVLRQIKADPDLRRIPVIMVTTTDDPREVDKCHELGCSTYITKPVEYTKFIEAIHRLGLFLLVIQVPPLETPKTP